MNSKIIIDVDKRNFKFCWENKDNILQRVALDNERIPLCDWKKFYETMEETFGDDTPDMLNKFNYKNDVMRGYMTLCDDGDYRLTLKELPAEIFGQKCKSFKFPTIFECKDAGYAYVMSMKEKYDDPQKRIAFLENELSQQEKKYVSLEEKYVSLQEENTNLKEEKKDLLQILDDISEKESKKAASERKTVSERKTSQLEYMYDHKTMSWRKVTGFDEFGETVLAPKGFPFDDVTGIKIINLYHRKGLTPKQIVSHLSLYGLNNYPEKTVRNFLRAYKKGLLDRAIRFCCNNPFNEVDIDSEKLLNKV